MPLFTEILQWLTVLPYMVRTHGIIRCSRTGTYSRIEFDTWKQINFDRNDCVADSQWLVTMLHGNEEEHRAATLTLAHSDTPQIIDLDTLGRPYQVSDDAGQENRFITHNHIDIAGLTVKVTDALGRDMTTHVYDTTGQMFYTFNIDSGHRWMLTNAMDMPVYLWDSRRNKIELSYDELLRPIGTKLNEDGSQSSKLVEAIEYGTDASSYTIGRPVNQMDQAGQIHNKTYDFKGNPLEIKRLLLRQFQGTIDWREEQVFETFELITGYTYDALNRPISETGPDGKIKYFFYNKAGLLEQLEFAKELYITNINYNEKGQRTDIYFGNNSKTRYDYDPLNFRLTRLLTTRNTGQDILQDLYYTYDPEGNIVQQTDKAQQTFYFGNQVIDPTGKYEYDALYRLVKAEGRELTGLNMPDNRDFPNEIQLPDPDSLQNYSHTYTYDALGNILRMVSDNWHRDYQYKTTNNLLNGIEDEHFEYRYDAHGNLLAMPHLETMTWDYNDRLSSSAINRDQQTFYRYDAGGNRTRKITQSGSNLLKERIYFANFEIYRERSLEGEIITERLTNNIVDGNKRIAMVDSLTIDRGKPIEPVTTIRYQYDNHLGSACLELDEQAQIISYEEYHPFGTTSYRSGRSLTETNLKRYKYVGKERDEETGLYYYGARYYAAWLCRFVSVDSLQHKYPHYTPYQYAGNKPVSYIDLDGLEETEAANKLPKLYYDAIFHDKAWSRVKENFSVVFKDDKTGQSDLVYKGSQSRDSVIFITKSGTTWSRSYYINPENMPIQPMKSLDTEPLEVNSKVDKIEMRDSRVKPIIIRQVGVNVKGEDKESFKFDLMIPFKFQSDEIVKSSFDDAFIKLKELATYLNENPGSKVFIRGNIQADPAINTWTSVVKGYGSAWELAIGRAMSVKEILVDSLGVDYRQVKTDLGKIINNESGKSTSFELIKNK
jgi:RHS repeat-associated protein